MAEATLLVSTGDGVAWLTLNRPASLNALDKERAAELAARLEEVAADESVRCVVVAAAGRAFSAGGDLKALKDADVASFAEDLRSGMNRVITLMRSMPKPVLCAVQGAAAGAGVGLALAADVVIAGRTASFTEAFSRVGLIPDAGNTWLLPRAVGDSRARAMMITAEPVPAEQALAMGIVWRVVDDELLASEALALAQRLAQMPTQSFALVKQALLASASNTLAQQLDLEADLQQRAAHTSDFREGVSAFLEKRKPRFTGR
ncbi:MAG: 2-(1,2-epoxy,2-dihydrophenyl)acetyl-CoA isomerase [Ramlibacter sp.]|nr:2-(1,2-epoxy,2-dihydrophenyl)acetyl-CoA isomerase [Ramlibacter sp.]